MMFFIIMFFQFFIGFMVLGVFFFDLGVGIVFGFVQFFIGFFVDFFFVDLNFSECQMFVNMQVIGLLLVVFFLQLGGVNVVDGGFQS